MANTKTGENLDSQLLYAIFTPALQKGYAQFAIKKTAPRQMPGGLTPADLNYLDPASKLFHIPATLYSVGQFSFNQMENPPACMVTRRDKPKTLILGDSGGYQILKGKLDVQSDNEREKIFNWLEANTDFAMTLDVPTAFAEDYGQFKECLTATKKHSKYWKKRYPTGQGQGNFLIVGGESGENWRPMKYEWVKDIEWQCDAAGVNFYFKQWGHWRNNPLSKAGGWQNVENNDITENGGRKLDGEIVHEHPSLEKIKKVWTAEADHFNKWFKKQD